MKITVTVRSRAEMDQVVEFVGELHLNNVEIDFSYLPKQLSFPFELPIVAVVQEGYPVRHTGEAAFEFLRRLAA